MHCFFVTLFFIGQYPVCHAWADDADPTLSALAQTSAWQKLLFFPRRLWGPKRSVLADLGFFADPHGRLDARAEIHTFVHELERSPKVTSDQHLACRFPARTLWLKEQLGFRLDAVKLSECEAFQTWFSHRARSGLSIVFSSYFLNNPASMFGHTFLRMRRKQVEDHQDSFFDDAVNFAANPTSMNPLFYAYAGLTGKFGGRFSLMPYFQKLQEYNSHESRDLWEYELNFSQKEIDFLFAILWEAGQFDIPYFYLDENCSFLLIMLLEAASPKIDIAKNFRFFTAPADTLIDLAKIPGLVERVTYRPASRMVFETRFAQLNRDEKKVLDNIILDKKSFLKPEDLEEVLNCCVGESRKKILDAIIAFIHFDEKLVLDQKPKKHLDLLENSRLLRSQIPLKTSPVSLSDISQPPVPPHTSNYTSRFGLGLWQQRISKAVGSNSFQKHTLLIVEAAPALHELVSPPRGLPADLELQMLTLRAALSSEKISLQEAILFRSVSLNPIGGFEMKPSWALDLAYKETALCVDGGLACAGFELGGSGGMSWPVSTSWGSFRLFTFALLAPVLTRDLSLKIKLGNWSGLWVDPLFSRCGRFMWRVYFLNVADVSRSAFYLPAWPGVSSFQRLDWQIPVNSQSALHFFAEIYKNSKSIYGFTTSFYY